MNKRREGCAPVVSRRGQLRRGFLLGVSMNSSNNNGKGEGRKMSINEGRGSAHGRNPADDAGERGRLRVGGLEPLIFERWGKKETERCHRRDKQTLTWGSCE